jgi:hypothetical protein
MDGGSASRDSVSGKAAVLKRRPGTLCIALTGHGRLHQGSVVNRSLAVKGCSGMETEVLEFGFGSPSDVDKSIIRARRAAFVARFIVLREGKRTRAHRTIEMMEWEDLTTVEELAHRFREAFVENGDNMTPVDRDLRRALAHSFRSLKYFVAEYAQRATTDFIGALEDYGCSNELLFGGEEQPRSGGWRLPLELRKLRERSTPEAAKPQRAPKKTAKEPARSSVVPA